MFAKFVTVLILANVCHHALGRGFITKEVAGKTFSYKIYATSQSWEEAERTCQLSGAHLAVIESRAEAKVIGTLIDELKPEIDEEDGENAPHYFYAIGLSKAEKSLDWKTVLGTPLDNASNLAPSRTFFYSAQYGFIDNEGRLLAFPYEQEAFICKK